jgi:putative peptidoglycan lipid II flippase
MAGTVVLSGIIQCCILWGRIRSGNFGLRLVRPQWNDKIKSMLKRFGVSLVGSGFYQITIIVGTLVASFQSGAVSWLYYADRIIQLPFAMIGLAVGTVLMSSISNALAEKNLKSVYNQQNFSMRRSLMLIIPCMVGLFVLAEPIIRNLFQYGAWTPESTHAVAIAIMIQCLVLPAMLISQIYSKTLYASQDVKTPVKTSIVSLGLAAVIYVGLFYHLGYLAIPVGVVISGYVKNLLLAHACKKKKLVKWDGKTIRTAIGFCVWSGILGVGLWFAPVDGLVSLCVAIAAFGILYLPVAYVMDKKL